MAIEAFRSYQLTDDVRLYPIDEHGKFRIQYFNLLPTTVVGDAGTTVGLVRLPPGRVRVLPHLSRFEHTAFGAGRTLDIGHRGYQKQGAFNGAVSPDIDEPENFTAFVSANDVSAVGAAKQFSNVLKYDMYSLRGPIVVARVNGGTIPVGATLSGYIAYIYE